ncbi:hypothetical protein SeMB42_g05684 [Synchytrium endobioticum]|uniref:Uncharacterized protein n=1 Tax=Synchytrium endobioticum TaxID=286115 RepID=A0A507CQ11_9FUNG|nr:hypothetical protein SeMB42_g05684 [Synchytrium endobioticum]TPX43969.1 hypothetical protein SeLEV6574_g04784 [Synchytrium endobioticum]
MHWHSSTHGLRGSKDGLVADDCSRQQHHANSQRSPPATELSELKNPPPSHRQEWAYVILEGTPPNELKQSGGSSSPHQLPKTV